MSDYVEEVVAWARTGLAIHVGFIDHAAAMWDAVTDSGDPIDDFCALPRGGLDRRRGWTGQSTARGGAAARGAATPRPAGAATPRLAGESIHVSRRRGSWAGQSTARDAAAGGSIDFSRFATGIRVLRRQRRHTP